MRDLTRKQYTDVLKTLDRSTMASKNHNLTKKQGVLGININQLLQYQVLKNLSGPTIQCVTSRFGPW